MLSVFTVIAVDIIGKYAGVYWVIRHSSSKMRINAVLALILLTKDVAFVGITEQDTIILVTMQEPMNEEASPPRSNAKLGRLRGILLEAEGSIVRQPSNRRFKTPTDSQIAYMVHNRQFMRKQYRIVGTPVHSSTSSSYTNRHGMLTTQRSLAALQPNNFLSILKLKSLKSKENSRKSLRKSDSQCESLFEVSRKMQEMLMSPGCSCICREPCRCGKRAFLRYSGETPRDKVNSLIQDCASHCSQKSWKQMQSLDKQLLSSLEITRKSIRRSI